MQLLEGPVEALDTATVQENEKCNVGTVPQEKVFRNETVNRADHAVITLSSQSLPTIHKTVHRAWLLYFHFAKQHYRATESPASHIFTYINQQHMMPAFTIILANILAIFSLASAAASDLRRTTRDRLLLSTQNDNDATFFPVEIPIDRAFDVQWNPPGHPLLSTYFLDTPYGDRGVHPYGSEHDDRDGYYTFLPSEEDTSQMSFVRKQEDGSYIQVYERVEFLLISDDVLLFNGDPHEGMGFPAGGGFGTLIKAPSIPAGDADGVWDTEALDQHAMSSAKEWLLKNFAGNELPVQKPIDIGDVDDAGNSDNNELIRGCGTVYRNSDTFLWFITVGVIVVIVAVIAFVVHRKCRQDPSNSENSDGKEGSEEGSIAKTFGDDESCSGV